MTADWYKEKLAGLKTRDRIQTLNEIRNNLTNAASVESSVSLNILTRPEVFDCVDNSIESEQSKLACDILTICMSCLDLEKSDATRLLERSLRHGNPNVRTIALTEIARSLKKNSRTNLGRDLILNIISCLDCTETTVGATAINILSQVLISDYDNPTIQNTLIKKLDAPDIVRCRVYEIVVNLAKVSVTMLNKVAPILGNALREMDSDDVLLHLNILELLVSLAEQNHGLIYLENNKVYEKISNRVELIEENPADRFLIPGFMKFFGKTAYSQPQKIVEGYPQIIQCLFECLLSEDIAVLPTAFDTMGNIAHSTQGKISLQAKYGDRLKEAFEAFRNYLQNLPIELKNRLFNALEITFKTDGEVSNEVSEITKTWCRYFTGSNNLEFLLTFIRNPFPDIKVACLSFLKSLCKYHWGILAIKNTTGFVEFLLDRRIEFDKDARFVKYEIISILAETTVFDTFILLQLKKYVEDGVHYVQGIVEVAVEGS